MALVQSCCSLDCLPGRARRARDLGRVEWALVSPLHANAADATSALRAVALRPRWPSCRAVAVNSAREDLHRGAAAGKVRLRCQHRIAPSADLSRGRVQCKVRGQAVAVRAFGPRHTTSTRDGRHDTPSSPGSRAGQRRWRHRRRRHQRPRPGALGDVVFVEVPAVGRKVVQKASGGRGRERQGGERDRCADLGRGRLTPMPSLPARRRWSTRTRRARPGSSSWSREQVRARWPDGRGRLRRLRQETCAMVAPPSRPRPRLFAGDGCGRGHLARPTVRGSRRSNSAFGSSKIDVATIAPVPPLSSTLSLMREGPTRRG